jgi:hypothetical protein
MLMVKNVYRLGLAAILGFSVLTACSGKADERDAESAASALVNTNGQIVAFGHISVEDILDKSEYDKIPKLKALIGTELQSLQQGLDLKKPVYYAVSAPFDAKGTPETAYGLVNVKDEAKLIDKFNQMGFTVEKTGELSYISEGDVTIGVRNKLAIIVSKKAPYDSKAEIVKAFTQTEGDESGGTTKDIIKEKGDIVAGVSIERLFTTANTSLNKLDASKKAELEKLVDDAFIKSEVSFEKGELKFTSKNFFSSALKDKLFFKEDKSAGILSKLGTGNAWMGMAANIDMRKLESFLNEYAPDFKQKLMANLPGEAKMALMVAGDNPLTALFSGQLGVVMTGNPSVADVPQFNAFLGLGTKGDMINDMVKGFLIMGTQVGDAYIMENTAIAPRKDGIYIYSANAAAAQKLIIPAGAKKDFGQKTFSMFIAFGQMDVKSLEVDPAARVIEILDLAVLNVDEDGSELILTAKDRSQNILAQALKYYEGMIEGEVSRVNGDVAAME